MIYFNKKKINNNQTEKSTLMLSLASQKSDIKYFVNNINNKQTEEINLNVESSIPEKRYKIFYK